MILITATSENQVMKISVESCALEDFWYPYVTSIDNLVISMPTPHGGIEQVEWGSIGISLRAFQKAGIQLPPPQGLQLKIELTNTTQAAAKTLIEAFGSYSNKDSKSAFYDIRTNQNEIQLLETTKDINCTTAVTDFNGETAILPRAVGFVEHVKPIQLNNYGAYQRYHNIYLTGSPGVDYFVYDDGVNVSSNVVVGTSATCGDNCFYLNMDAVGDVTVTGCGTVTATNNALKNIVAALWTERVEACTSATSSWRTTSTNVGTYVTSQVSVKDFLSELCAGYGHLACYRSSVWYGVKVEGTGLGVSYTELIDVNFLDADYETADGPVKMVKTNWQRRWTYTKESKTYVTEAEKEAVFDHSVFYEGTASGTEINKLVHAGFTYAPGAGKGGDMLRPGMIAKNTTYNTETLITLLESDQKVVLNDDIFESGDSYEIGYKKTEGSIESISSYTIDAEENEENLKSIITFKHMRKVAIPVPFDDMPDLDYMGRVSATERRRFYTPLTLHFSIVTGIVYDFASELVIYECVGTQYEKNPQTLPYGGIVIQNALHYHDSDNTFLSPESQLSINNAYHAHLADSVVLFLPLLINNTYHDHTVDNILLGETGTDYTSLAACKAAWFMNDTGTTETDRSGNGSTLTVSSGDTIERLNGSLPSGFSGYYRHFEYNDGDHMSLPDEGPTDISGSDQNITFFFRFRVEGSTGNFQYLLGKYYGTSEKQFSLFLGTDGKPRCIISNDGNTDNVAVAATDLVTDGEWHTVAIVYDDTDIRIYSDGALDSNSTWNPKSYTSGIYDSTADLYIGALYNGSPVNFFDGDIYEAAIFNDALSAAQVLEIHQNGIKGDKGASE